LGKNYGQIRDRCNALATTDLHKNVVARTLVISPDISLMDALPEERRLPALAELTEAAVEGWFEALDLPTPEYSYVIHRGETRPDRPDGTLKDDPGPQDFLHSHVVLAATVPGFDAERHRYWVGREQMPLLHEAARDALEGIWTRELGPQRVQDLDQALARRAERLQALDIARQTPDALTVQRALAEIGLEPSQPRPTRPLDPDIDR